jgi:Mrp family chromosome partitioning ATPase
VLVPVLLDLADRSIRDAPDAAEALGAPVLATLPATRRQAVLATQGTPGAAAYRALAVASVATDRLPNAILVTAPSGRAQDSVAANFAAALADLGVNVALVATDPRHSWYLDAAGAVLSGVDFTLPELLDMAQAGQLNGSLSKRLVGTNRENLSVVPPGKTPYHGTLDALPSLLNALSDSGIDVTVIAGPAILEDPNATIMAWSTRSVLWAVRGGQITEEEADEAASRLSLAGVVPFGIAMIDAT